MNPLTKATESLHRAFKSGDTARLTQATQALYRAREPLGGPPGLPGLPGLPPRNRPADAQQRSASRGPRDAEVHDILIDLASREAPEAVRTALFEGLFAAAEDAVARGVQSPDHFLDMVDESITRLEAGLKVENGDLGVPLWRWLAEGFRRRLGLDNPRALSVGERFCRAISMTPDERDADSAHALVREVLAASERVAGPGHPDTLRRRLIQVQALMNTGRFEDALGEVERVLSNASPAPETEPLLTLARFRKGYLELRLGRIQAGFATFEGLRQSRTPLVFLRPSATHEEVTSVDPILGPLVDLRFCLEVHGDLGGRTMLSAISRLAAGLEQAGRHEDAGVVRRYYESCLTALEQERGDSTDQELTELARHLNEKQAHAESATVLRRVLARQTSRLGLSHPETRRTRHVLGVQLGKARESAAAIDLLRPLSEELRLEGPPEVLQAVRFHLATALFEATRYEEALTAYGEVVRGAMDARDVRAREVRDDARFGTGMAMRRLGRRAEARQWMQPLYEDLQSSHRLTSARGQHLVDELVATLLEDKNPAALNIQRALLEETQQKHGPAARLNWIESHNLGLVHAKLGELGQAERFMRDALDRETRAFRENSNAACLIRPALALVLDKLGRTEEAERLRAGLPRQVPDEFAWEPIRFQDSGA